MKNIEEKSIARYREYLENEEKARSISPVVCI